MARKSKEPLTFDQALLEWKEKSRRMPSRSATNWFCSRVNGFRPELVDRFTADGNQYRHVVASDGLIRVDLAPYDDKIIDLDEVAY